MDLFELITSSLIKGIQMGRYPNWVGRSDWLNMPYGPNFLYLLLISISKILVLL
jgi:hypothetical protein